MAEVYCAGGVKQLWGEADQSPDVGMKLNMGGAMPELSHTESCRVK